MKIVTGIIWIVIICYSIRFFYNNSTFSPLRFSPGPVTCTQEAKLCPDGSSVGRIGPKCEFAMCPALIQTSTISEKISDLTLKVGQKGVLSDITITFNSFAFSIFNRI